MILLRFVWGTVHVWVLMGRGDDGHEQQDGQEVKEVEMRRTQNLLKKLMKTL